VHGRARCGPAYRNHHLAPRLEGSLREQLLHRATPLAARFLLKPYFAREASPDTQALEGPLECQMVGRQLADAASVDASGLLSLSAGAADSVEALTSVLHGIPSIDWKSSAARLARSSTAKLLRSNRGRSKLSTDSESSLVAIFAANPLPARSGRRGNVAIAAGSPNLPGNSSVWGLLSRSARSAPGAYIEGPH
jgi:hypothetical protein